MEEVVEDLKLEVPVALFSFLENNGDDANKMTQEELLSEAKYCLSLYFESGHSYNDGYEGIWGDEAKKEARKEVKDLKSYIGKLEKQIEKGKK